MREGGCEGGAGRKRGVREGCEGSIQMKGAFPCVFYVFKNTDADFNSSIVGACNPITFSKLATPPFCKVRMDTGDRRGGLPLGAVTLRPAVTRSTAAFNVG